MDIEGGYSMKKWCILLLISACSFPIAAQNIIYANLKQLLAQKGDTLTSLQVEKRSRNQVVLTGGADYRITAGDDESMRRLLKKRCFAVETDKGELYINCRKLRYRKLRFGGWYAPALRLGQNVYFSAMPMGSVIGAEFVDGDDARLGGRVGDALATSSLVTHRVYYELDGETGKVDYVGEEKMLLLLKDYPQWKEEYLHEDSQEAAVIKKYLLRLQATEKSALPKQ